MSRMISPDIVLNILFNSWEKEGASPCFDTCWSTFALTNYFVAEMENKKMIEKICTRRGIDCGAVLHMAVISRQKDGRLYSRQTVGGCILTWTVNGFVDPS